MGSQGGEPWQLDDHGAGYLIISIQRYEDELIDKSRLKLKVAVHGDGASDVIYDNFRSEGRTIAPFES